MSLTARQRQILDYIRQTLVERGAPPTRADIMAAFGFRSPTAAEDHLRALARKGAIELVPGAARGIRLPDGGGLAGLPLVGRVAAGAPILAVENVERRVPVADGLFTPRADFLLRVRGESMRNVGILDGDLLAVHRTQEARNGQIVVARIDEDVTVKRWQQNGHTLLLIAENADFAPIEVDLRQQPVEIEGLAVGVIRQLGDGT
jgi:repressor LexA